MHLSSIPPSTQSKLVVSAPILHLICHIPDILLASQGLEASQPMSQMYESHTVIPSMNNSSSIIHPPLTSHNSLSVISQTHCPVVAPTPLSRPSKQARTANSQLRGVRLLAQAKACICHGACMQLACPSHAATQTIKP